MAGFPVIKHGRNGERREVILRPTPAFDGLRWRSRKGSGAGVVAFAEMASVEPATLPDTAPPQMSPQIAPVLKRNCRPAELARSLTVALKKDAKGDREALNLTTPSVEYYRLLSDGLNGVLLRPDKISHHEAKRDRLVDLLLSEVRREEWRSEVRGGATSLQRGCSRSNLQ